MSQEKYKPREFLTVTYILPRKGMRIVQADCVRNQKVEDVVFEKHGYVLFTSGSPRLKLKGAKRGRALRRFLRDYVKTQGGLPDSCNFWLSGFR